MNNKFYTYQRRDNPNCGYGMTGYFMLGGESGFDLLFLPDEGSAAFKVSPRDIFGFPKKWWAKNRVKWITAKMAVERTLKSRYGENVLY